MAHGLLNLNKREFLCNPRDKVLQNAQLNSQKYPKCITETHFHSTRLIFAFYLYKSLLTNSPTFSRPTLTPPVNFQHFWAIHLLRPTSQFISLRPNITHVPAHEQAADLLTNPLSPLRFEEIRSKLIVFDHCALVKPS